MVKTRRGRGFKAFALGLLGLTMFSLSGTPRPVSAVQASHPVINQIQIDSLANAGGTEDDWVELYNPTASDQSLIGWSIQKSSSNGATSSPYKEALDGVIPAKGFYLIVRNNAATAASLKALADHLASDSFSLSAGNIVSLVNDNSAIQDYADPNIVDFVGFGTAKFFEGSSAAPAIPETKSIKRLTDGDDTDQNGADFGIVDNPVPRNRLSAAEPDPEEIGGKVILTVNVPAVAVSEISGTQAKVTFETNADALVQVAYGLTAAYGSFSAETASAANTPMSVWLTGLACGTTYHLSVQAVSQDESESDLSADQAFTTPGCGLELDSLAMTRSEARANNRLAEGWEWRFSISVLNPSESTLKMKFDPWTGNSLLSAAGNMQFSVNNGTNWTDITADSAYPASGLSIIGLDKDTTRPGRQIEVLVRMKVPYGTLRGFYRSHFGILTE